MMGGGICYWYKEPTLMGGHVKSLTWLVGRSPRGATEAHDQGTLGRAICQDACSGYKGGMGMDAMLEVNRRYYNVGLLFLLYSL